MIMQVWAKTDVGRKREKNEDSILVDEDLGLYIVADGMGGHEGGEVASRMAVETVRDTLREEIKDPKFSPKRFIEKAYLSASKSIFRKGHIESPELMGMGTTMVVALFYENKLYLGNVGDSRVYLFKRPNFWQVTDDHSLLNEQMKMGMVTENDIDDFVGKNVITRSVGYEESVEVDIFERDLEPDETYLLCSDGLSGLISDKQTLEILMSHKPDKALELLVKGALDAGGDDNISVILLRSEEGGN